MVNIYTKNRLIVDYQKFDYSTFLANDQPVFYLLDTDSCSAGDVNRYYKILSEAEKLKASRFRFKHDQNRSIIAHARLRMILAALLDLPPEGIDFNYNLFGKPFLSEKHKKIYFNLSHSSGIQAFIFSAISEVGIDIEKIDKNFEFEPIARSYFSKPEYGYIFENNIDACDRYFLLWTRKEAFLKAIGRGIGDHLNIEVFKEINSFQPEIHNLELWSRDFFLDSFIFQNEFRVSTASNIHSEFTGVAESKTDYFNIFGNKQLNR